MQQHTTSESNISDSQMKTRTTHHQILFTWIKWEIKDEAEKWVSTDIQEKPEENIQGQETKS